jgi:predicted nucleic acid-binding protein
MPTNADRPDLLVDTSVAVALVVADHTHHDAVFEALRGSDVGLAGHAAFETFSVLTRLPPPARLTPVAAARLLSTNFPHTRFLGAKAASELWGALPGRGIAGASVYDALVGAAAKEHGVVLATRDRRAGQIYRALDVEFEFVADASSVSPTG